MTVTERQPITIYGIEEVKRFVLLCFVFGLIGSCSPPFAPMVNCVEAVVSPYTAFPIITPTGMGLVSITGDTLVAPVFRLVEPRASLLEFRLFRDTSFMYYEVGDDRQLVNERSIQTDGLSYMAIDSADYFINAGMVCHDYPEKSVFEYDRTYGTWPYVYFISRPSKDGIQFWMRGNVYGYQDANGRILFQDTGAHLALYLTYEHGPRDRSAYIMEQERLCGQPYEEWDFVASKFFRWGDLRTFMIGHVGETNAHYHSVLCTRRIFL